MSSWPWLFLFLAHPCPQRLSVLFLQFLRPEEASFWLGWPSAAPAFYYDPRRPRQTRGRGAQTVLDTLHKQLGVFVNAKVPKCI